ncbi:hypothetical protein KKG41_02035 [Patescibacteria group bacterium]|nr:hypothetical protein [Patescibacteria group bacterium]MBU1890515.1 hypothetical protein [Patescibacteria group bacterium]
MSQRGTIVIIIIAAIIIAGIYYYTQEESVSGVITSIKTSAERSKDSCEQRCLDQEYARGECMAGGDAEEYAKVCTGGGGIDITDQENPIQGCDYRAGEVWDVCCCYQ